MKTVDHSEPVRIPLDELFKKIFASLAQFIDSFTITETDVPEPNPDPRHSTQDKT